MTVSPTVSVKQKPPFARNHLLRDASWQAVYDAMTGDPSVHIFGEGARVKAHFDAPRIEADFLDRVHTMPISEDGTTNFAVGAALLGVKPVVDVISADFLYRCMDAICNTAAKLNDMRPGEAGRTIVIRAEFLTGGPTTGQRNEALFAHIPGLCVVVPSTPRDAYGLMRTALATPGVTLFFEDREVADDGAFLADDLRIENGASFFASIRRLGQRGTCTIVTYGVMRQRVEALVGPWKKDGDYYKEPNLDAGIVDLRSIYPLDMDCIKYAVGRTGKLLVIEPDVEHGGVGAEIVARIAQEMPHVRVKRLGARRATIPASPALHGAVLPTDEEVTRAIADWD